METNEKLLKDIMESNPIVRYTAVCTTDGDIEWQNQRDGVTNIIPQDETKASMARAAASWKARKELSVLGTGRGMYSMTTYEKIKRITVPLDDTHILFISIDNTAPKIEGEYAETVMAEIMTIVDSVNK